MPELQLSLSWAHNNPSARASAPFPLVPRTPDHNPSEPTPLPAQKLLFPAELCQGERCLLFLPSFPFSLQFVLSSRRCAATEAALHEARLLAGRSLALVWAAEVPGASGVSHSTSDLSEGPQISMGAPSHGEQVAEQLFTLLPLGVPVGEGTFMTLCLWPPRGQWC